jgi:hypothetical protein
LCLKLDNKSKVNWILKTYRNYLKLKNENWGLISNTNFERNKIFIKK